MNEKEWIDIISKIYTNLHNSERVMHTSKESDKKRERLLNYFNRLEEVHNKVRETKSKAGEKILKNFYYELYLIKPQNIPESYFENQQRIMRERGYGNVEITESVRQEMINQVIEDQKTSLEKWIDYFLYDEESKSYGMWEKYWVFQGLQKLGKYDKENKEFNKRDKTTVYPFPPVEREYIFTTLHLMEEYLKSKKTEEEIKSALESGNFKQLYEYVIKQSFLQGKNQSYGTNGIWIKYNQGSDYNKLRDSLQGYYTGWCTAAGENFAKTQLEGGDFYVYYSEDENKEYKVPRIAIRMEGSKIGEIRGIASNQNMEPEMIPVLNEKLKEFPDKDLYIKKEHDMLILTQIERKQKENIELTKEELRFLYEIDSKIEGFGYQKDPRIEEIINRRNQKKDLVFVFECREDEIALTQEEALSGNIIYYNGNIDLSDLKSADGLKLPQIIGGSLYLNNLTSAEGLTLPQKVGGNLFLENLKSDKDLVLPQTIVGSLFLNDLTSAEGLEFPQTIGSDLYLGGLTSTKGLLLSQKVGRDLHLWSLTSAEGLKLPKTIGGNLSLNGLKSAKSLTLPQTIGGSLLLNDLTSAKGLVLPQTMVGNLSLRSLTSAEGLTLPKTIGKDLDLNSLTNAQGLTLPQTIGGSLFLNDLTSAKDLILPQIVGDNLDLSAMTSAEGLTLPQQIGGHLYLWDLTSCESLRLPYGFPIDRLVCQEHIKQEIVSNTEKYYQSMEEKKEISSQKK